VAVAVVVVAVVVDSRLTILVQRID